MQKPPSPSTAPRSPARSQPEFYRPVPGQGVPNAMAVPGYALVRDDREVKIKQGRSQLSFTDVAALIDPTTVTFTSLTDPATRVLEQNFQFDLVSTQKLLLKFIDKQITVDKPNGNTRDADHRHAALGDRRHRAARQRWLYLLAARLHLGAVSGSARRPQHAPDAGVGHPVAGRRHAQGARHLPDRRHHLVGRLQPHLQRRRGCQQRPARSVRLGQHHQPVRAPRIRMRSSS